MSRRKDKTIIDEVNDYIIDINSDEAAVDIISELYEMVIELAHENGILEHENARLERQLNIAEAWIMKNSDEEDPDNEPHLLS